MTFVPGLESDPAVPPRARIRPRTVPGARIFLPQIYARNSWCMSILFPDATNQTKQTTPVDPLIVYRRVLFRNDTYVFVTSHHRRTGLIFRRDFTRGRSSRIHVARTFAPHHTYHQRFVGDIAHLNTLVRDRRSSSVSLLLLFAL